MGQGVSVYMENELISSVDECNDFGSDRSRSYKIQKILEEYFGIK
jgi:metal-responsive CopG/Arc/MetJ family transcriptional regulator